MSSLRELATPALLLDLDVLERNLGHMASRASALGVRLRPHIKTHKCVEVAARQRDLGADGITASTLYEARVFADHGFDDITWAFPLILSRIDEALDLADKIDLGLLIDSREALEALAARPPGAHPRRVWLKVDCGYHRAGVDPASDDAIELPRAIDAVDALAFAGILTHSGHAYHVRGKEALRRVADEERNVMTGLAERLRQAGVPVDDVSVGSTPAMSAVESLDGITEARPGNYAFYDYTQSCLGACEVGDCALTVLSSVVSCLADHAVIDAGALALSKDPGEGTPGDMGPVFATPAGAELDADLRVRSLSQEHGIVTRPLPVGTLLRLLPNHSCLTAACFDHYHVVRGDQVVDEWKVWRGR